MIIYIIDDIIIYDYIYLKEKAMAPHSSTFAQKIPWTEEPGRLQSMGKILHLFSTYKIGIYF